MAPFAASRLSSPTFATPQMLSNPFWSALVTEQAAIAIGSQLARRYPADVIPFVGIPEHSAEAMRAVRDLLGKDDAVYLLSNRYTDCPGIAHLGELACLRMHFAWKEQFPLNGPAIDTLTAADAPEMVALTDIAFPGFFRPRTYVLGSYFGIRVNGALVAMAGERLALPGYREISAVCTRPDFTGRGYAARLISHILQLHSSAGLRSFLHVAAQNRRAIELYERLGFVKASEVLVHRICRA